MRVLQQILVVVAVFLAVGPFLFGQFVVWLDASYDPFDDKPAKIVWHWDLGTKGYADSERWLVRGGYVVERIQSENGNRSSAVYLKSDGTDVFSVRMDGKDIRLVVSNPDSIFLLTFVSANKQGWYIGKYAVFSCDYEGHCDQGREFSEGVYDIAAYESGYYALLFNFAEFHSVDAGSMVLGGEIVDVSKGNLTVVCCANDQALHHIAYAAEEGLAIFSGGSLPKEENEDTGLYFLDKQNKLVGPYAPFSNVDFKEDEALDFPLTNCRIDDFLYLREIVFCIDEYVLPSGHHFDVGVWKSGTGIVAKFASRALPMIEEDGRLAYLDAELNRVYYQNP